MSVTPEGSAPPTEPPVAVATVGGSLKNGAVRAPASPQQRDGDITRRASVVVCPHLESVGGSWRMAQASRDHRCVALAPPAPQPDEKQRRHCLTAAHVECSVYGAARAAREAALAGSGDPHAIAAADAARRPQPRTAPILLEPPRLVDQLLRLQTQRAPGQLLLIGLMVVAFAIVGLSRLSAAPAEAIPSAAAASPAPSSAGGAPSPVPATPRPSTVPASPPAASSPPASPPPGARTTYTVKRGDTLIGVATKFRTTVAKIRALNGLKSSTLKIGQVLKIP